MVLRAWRILSFSACAFLKNLHRPMSTYNIHLSINKEENKIKIGMVLNALYMASWKISCREVSL